MGKRELGIRGEQLALQYLREEKGYHIRCCNYRNRLGEIDIIADDGYVLVFIEVKTRTSLICGRPAEAVESHKQQKISRVAAAYLSRYGLWQRRCRFDVVEVYLASEPPRIRHYRQAFWTERSL